MPTASPYDYEPLTNIELSFNTGDTKVPHTINIINDDICANKKEFSCSVSLLSQDSRISIAQSHSRVVISDAKEQECRKEILNSLSCIYALNFNITTGIMIVGFETEMYTVIESQELVELSITIIDPPSEGALRPFTLLLDTNNGSAGM